MKVGTILGVLAAAAAAVAIAVGAPSRVAEFGPPVVAGQAAAG